MYEIGRIVIEANITVCVMIQKRQKTYINYDQTGQLFVECTSISKTIGHVFFAIVPVHGQQEKKSMLIKIH